MQELDLNPSQPLPLHSKQDEEEEDRLIRDEREDDGLIGDEREGDGLIRDEREDDGLIGDEREDDKDRKEETQKQEEEEKQEKQGEEEKEEKDSSEVIDPFVELVTNNDVVPLLAVLSRVDLEQIVQGKPLLSRLCTMHLPLAQILAGRDVVFGRDADNRTALHEAIAADDINSAAWCIEHNIGNSTDNFGCSPILEAIKLGRRACFLLCLHYELVDPLAAHACATYNRAW